jgi:hypothetical protein
MSSNAEILAKAILDIELAIAENLQPGHTQYPLRALEQILAIIDCSATMKVRGERQSG